MQDWKKTLEKELKMAVDARARGNEGQARVCARRAAGVIVREYLLRHGVSSRTSNAFDVLKSLLELPGISDEARRAADYLTMRVNENFQLPTAVDLVEEARNLCQSLLPGEFPR
jgi:hypothetical protein